MEPGDDNAALRGTARLLQAKISSGVILRQTFSVFFKNIVSFGLITVCITWPEILLRAYGIFVDKEAPGSFGFVDLAVIFLSLILTPMVTGALTYGVFEVVRERDVSFGEVMRIGLAKLPPVLMVSIVQGFFIFIGMMLCGVPGIIAACMLAVAVPVAVIENAGVTKSINRSMDLTKGFRWTVFGVIFTIGLLQFALGLAINVIAGISLPLFFGFQSVISIFVPGLSATASALIYYHLRSEKEALDVEAIAEVFA